MRKPALVLKKKWRYHPKQSVKNAAETVASPELSLSPADSVEDRDRLFTHSSHACSGTGKIIRDKCPTCKGSGYVTKREKLSVTIPAGIDHGQSVRLRGKGEPGKNGGARGDLLVEVFVERHPEFERHDIDIYSVYHISYPRAALGGEVIIPTIDGEVAYTVKAGTQSGTRIRLRGKGVPTLRNKNVRGNHYVDVVVDVPTSLNKEQKEMLEAFEATLTKKNTKKIK